jgi:hypothetical protein
VSLNGILHSLVDFFKGISLNYGCEVLNEVMLKSGSPTSEKMDQKPVLKKEKDCLN